MRLYEAVSAFIQSLSNLSPVAILLDNFQWAYEADYEMVTFLLRELAASSDGTEPGANVLLAVAYRDEEVPVDHPLRKIMLSRPAGVRFVELRLQPFIRSEVYDFVVALAGGVEPAGGTKAVEALVDRILEESQGNPYHVEEMAKVVLGEIASPPEVIGGTPQGAVTRADSTHLAQGSETTRRHVGGLVQARLKGLSEQARLVIRAASVVGESIEFELLAGLAGIDEDDLLDVVDELIRDRFLLERDRGDLFDFSQQLIRDAVYAAIPEEIRRRLHARMVELLASKAEVNPEGFAAIVALHAERAELRNKAARFYLSAGDAALQGNRVDEAERYYDKARSLGALMPSAGGGTSTAEIQLEVRKGNIFLARGELHEAAQVFEDIMTRAKEKGDDRLAGHAARRLGVACARSGNHVLAIANLEWALGVAQALEDSRMEADARDGLGSAHLVRGNFDKALNHLKAALALRKQDDDRVGATRALYGAAQALAARGELGNAVRMHEDALKFSLGLAETAGAARGHAELGELSRMTGEVDAAREHFDSALELARKAGASDVEIAVEIGLARIAIGRGESMVARRHAADATQAARNVGDKRLLARALLAFGEEAFARFDLSTAKSRFEESRKTAHHLGDRVVRAATARALSRVALKARALDSARAYLDEAIRTHEKIGDLMGQIEDEVDQGAVAVAEALAQTTSTGGTRSSVGRSLLEPALGKIGEALPVLQRERAVGLGAYAHLIQGEIRLALRQSEPAIEAAQEAAQLAARCEVNDFVLRARLIQGRAHLLARRFGDARGAYREALDVLKSNAAQIPDKAERMMYLAEPSRRSLVDEIKNLTSIGR